MATPTQTIVPRQHQGVIDGATGQFRSLFATSRQSMYLFLDDRNKSCNARFAKLLGYESPEAWSVVGTSFTQAFVHPDSQALLVDTYQQALRDGVGASIPVTWLRKDGRPVDTQVLLVPIDFEDHRLALHFIDPA